MQREVPLTLVPGKTEMISEDVDMLPILVPTEEEFRGQDYMAAPQLDRLCVDLRERHPIFADFANLSILCLWKREGGKSKGKAIGGKIQAATGLVGYLVDAAFVLWLAADHFRPYSDENYILPPRIAEAALCHELCHLRYDPESGTTGLRGHDVEAFEAEIELYGLWHADLRRVARTCAQLEMFGQERSAVTLR